MKSIKTASEHGDASDKKVYWWPQGEKLVFISEEATANYWDKHWDGGGLRDKIASSRNSRLWRGLTKRYLPATGLRVIEGGCGCGHLVDAMTYWGYEAVGVDYAEQTILRIKEVRPDLNVRLGDVRRLEFEDSSYDGCLSLGVIEHFWEGYEDIIKEMHRVLRPGGYALITFPSISRLDRLKIRVGGYQRLATQGKPEGFYQFALNARHVSRDIERLGFRIVRKRYMYGLLGLERVFEPVRRFNILANKIAADNRVAKYLVYGLSFSLAVLSGHMTLMVCRKT